jgi:uncharacterized membrane protein YkoI
MSRILPIATALFLVASGTAVYAGKPTNDAVAAANAKISLSAAATVAEQHVQGKAVRAEYERQKGGSWVYDVEVVAGSKVFDVKVDSDKGTVIASTEDKVDHDNDGDEID